MSSELPVHLTRFIGRERELEALHELLARERLVTLTGPGGTGKTRLAGEVSARAQREATLVRWVDLAPIAADANVARQACVALDLAERAGVPFAQLVADAIGGTRALLVLDNCEHVVAATATFVEALLMACPGLTILATSREALGIAGEAAWLVPPLGTEEAQQLFVERASTVTPGFAASPAAREAIAEICRRLDGIPLAIELAAARVRVLSPPEIAARLDDAFRLLSSGSRTAIPRHRTLRATMEWSLALLGPAEQTLLRRLSVFAGGFGLEAAEAVCVGGPIDAEDVLDGITTLVDKSWIVMEPGDRTARYFLLETMRQYARELLVAAGEAEHYDRAHAAYVLDLVERVAPRFVGGANDAALVRRLRLEVDNTRRAADWMLSDAGRGELALRLGGALFWIWYTFGSFRELRALLDRVLAHAPVGPPLPRGRALVASALTALAQGEYALAESQFEAALPLLADGADDAATSIAMAKLGASQLLGGRVEASVATLDEAIRRTADLPPSDMRAIFARFWRSWAAYLQGDLALAKGLMVCNLEAGVGAALPITEAHSRAVLARIEVAMGHVDVACAEATQALEIEWANHDGWGIALAIDAIAVIAWRRGRPTDAVRLMAGTEALRTRFAMAIPGVSPAEREAHLAELRAELGDAFDDAWTEGAALATEALVTRAFAETARNTTEHRVVAPIRAPSPQEGRLRVHALGPLQIHAGGHLIEARQWGSARPRELLIHLLLHPEGRTKEQVGLAFWPDASSAQLRNSFHVTLHRLRRTLGAAEAVVLEGERYRIDPAWVEEFDVEAFERALDEALTALKRRAAGATQALGEALDRYRGDFLDGEPMGDWHLEHRARLQRRYVEGLMTLGGALTGEARHAKAAEAFRRVLARDELHEEALRALMRAQVEAGERAQALREYSRFAERLERELGAAPSKETLRLVTEFRAG